MSEPNKKKSKLVFYITLATMLALLVSVYVSIVWIINQPGSMNTAVLRPKPVVRSIYDASQIGGIKRESVFIPSKDGSKIHAWIFRVPNSAKITIVSHGNAGNISNRLYIADVMAKARSSALLYDYRGYGLSTGHATIPGILQDGLTVYDYVRDNVHYPAKEILLYGESIGTGVTCHIANNREAAGIILQSGIADLPSMGKHLFHFMLFYPDSVFPEPHLNNVKLMKTITAPLLLLHGKRDTVSPFQNSEKLFAAANEPKKLVFLENCGHNDMGVQDHDLFYKSIEEFVAGLPGSAKAQVSR